MIEIIVISSLVVLFLGVELFYFRCKRKILREWKSGDKILIKRNYRDKSGQGVDYTPSDINYLLNNLNQSTVELISFDNNKIVVRHDDEIFNIKLHQEFWKNIEKCE
jgi:hypothetical protein